MWPEEDTNFGLEQVRNTPGGFSAASKRRHWNRREWEGALVAKLPRVLAKHLTSGAKNMVSPRLQSGQKDM